MYISATDGKKIQRWAKGGKTIAQICKLLNGGNKFTDDDYKSVQVYMWENGCLPIMGAKRRVSNHLKKLKTATRQGEREYIIEVIDDAVDYLYYGYRETLQELKTTKKELRALKSK